MDVFQSHDEAAEVVFVFYDQEGVALEKGRCDLFVAVDLRSGAGAFERFAAWYLFEHLGESMG